MSGLFNNFYKNKRLLITGHTGFKGSWLSMWLNQLGAQVIGYALTPPSKPSLFEVCNLKKEMISIIGDVRNLNKLKRVFSKHQPQIVFHLAAQSLVRESYKNPIETYETNIMGTVNVLEILRKTTSVKAGIIVTSDKCYENKGQNYKYQEKDPMGGHDPYSSSKGCVELVTAAYLKSFFNPKNRKNLPPFLASARAGNVIGGGDWGQDRLIPDCVRSLAKKRPILLRYPNAIRPWQHVLESLYGYLLLAKNLYQNGHQFSGGWNFGSEDGDSKPVKWLVNQIIKNWGASTSWKADKNTNPYEAHCLKLDSTKAKTKLGWQPQWNLGLALRKTIAWYKAYYQQNQNMLKMTLSQIKEYENAILKKEQ